MSETQTLSGFAALSVHPRLVEILDRAGMTLPTPIQAEAIPVALEGRDVVGIAQTGTGKTLAFAVPMIQRLGRGETGLILAPTRELAQQIAETFVKLGERCALVVGGDPMFRQVRELRNRPAFIIATPGRLIDHLQQRTVRLDGVSIAVLDEADRMLDMGFAPAIERIFSELQETRQTLLFSATMPKSIEDLAGRWLREPVRIEVAPPGTPSHLIEQELLYLRFEEKHDTLNTLLDDHEGPVLVFARTRHGARKLAESMREYGHRAAEIHADRTLAQRRAAMHGFKSGDVRVLVATDIAARGIDVKEIALVVNFDLPDNPEDYVHRIGRTGRAGNEGKAVSFALAAQSRLVRDIERILGKELPVSPASTAPPKSRAKRAPRERHDARGIHRDRPVREHAPRPSHDSDRPAYEPRPSHRDHADRPERTPGPRPMSSNDRPVQRDFFAEQREREARNERPEAPRREFPRRDDRGGFPKRDSQDRPEAPRREFPRRDDRGGFPKRESQDRPEAPRREFPRRDDRGGFPKRESQDRPGFGRPQPPRASEPKKSTFTPKRSFNKPPSDPSSGQAPPKRAHRGWSGKPGKRNKF